MRACPKVDKQLAGGQEQKSSPQKGTFEGSAHQEYCLLWGGVGLTWPCPRPNTHMILLPLCRARLPTIYTYKYILSIYIYLVRL